MINSEYEAWFRNKQWHLELFLSATRIDVSTEIILKGSDAAIYRLQIIGGLYVLSCDLSSNDSL